MEEEIEFVVLPYQFEPEETSDGETSDENSAYSDDEQVPDVPVEGPDTWCQCNNCSHMPTEAESRCCTYFSAVQAKMEDLPCITNHPGFHANCLNKDVLEVSFYEFLDYNGPIGDEEPVHKLYRYIAYRRFIRWIWHRLGKGKRRPIPSCAVTKIRATFPSEEYTGFKYPRDY